MAAFESISFREHRSTKCLPLYSASLTYTVIPLQVLSRAFHVNLPGGACAKVTESDTSLTTTGMENGEPRPTLRVFRIADPRYQVLKLLIINNNNKSYRKTWKTKTPPSRYHFYLKLASFLLRQRHFADTRRKAIWNSLNRGKSSKIIQLFSMQVSVYKSSPPPPADIQQVVILAESSEPFTSCITATSCGNPSQCTEEKTDNKRNGIERGLVCS